MSWYNPKAKKWHCMCTHKSWSFRIVKCDRDHLVPPLYFVNDEIDVQRGPIIEFEIDLSN